MKDLDLHEIKRLRDLKWGWSKIAALLGVSKYTVRCRVDPNFHEYELARHRRQTARGRDYHNFARIPHYCLGDRITIPQSVEDARRKRLDAPYRSHGEQILGSPPIGYSALDRKQVSA